MSIETEIGRIQMAKDVIKQAIQKQGVSVPDSAKIDDMGSLIEQIQASGGSSGQFAEIVATEWTPPSDTDKYPLTRKNVKYALISDKSAINRPNSAVVALMLTDAEFFTGFKPISELTTGYQGNLTQTVNYYGKRTDDSYIQSSEYFVSGRTYDVILVY